jgi:hypothetical protein
MAIGITGANNGYSRKVADERFIQTAGGTVTGNLTVTGTLSTTLLEALSANITVIDIKVYELSGFSVKGDVDIEGNVSASNIGSIASSNFTISDTHPISPTEKDIWYYSVEGQQFLYYNNTWIEM